VIAEFPSEAGAVHVNEAEPAPGTAVTLLGTPSVIRESAVEGAPLPPGAVAATTTEYEDPACSPVIAHVVVEVVQPCWPFSVTT
jgi:hypothetical protein